ncbi:UBN2_3 domain-containing protein [Cephalotus follicularis]|uniref:UBN2_3 domain-containing protein n=1 Tax=Cephalotus follicularis TaxID=3775 RepID=A0A1Q3BU13_CEPFO|nr:UBN2_3 domain-containing protein [Cephalotus follicularis]
MTSKSNSSSLHNLQITSIKLDGSNYPQCSKAVQTFLKGIGLVSHLTAQPDKKDIDLAKWEQTDARILTMMWNSMEPKISCNLMHMETTKEVWDECKVLYSGAKNMTRICEIWSELFDLKKGDKTI